MPWASRTSLRPCAAPERSTELDSLCRVFINHCNNSVRDSSPMPHTSERREGEEMKGERKGEEVREGGREEGREEERE